MGKIGFGCAALSGKLFEHEAMAILETAFDNDILHFDTAPLYGRGYSEKILGKFLIGKREKITITTKFGLGDNIRQSIPVQIALPLNWIKKRMRKHSSSSPAFHNPDLLSYRKIEAKDIKGSLENSLRSLRTDYIDYYLLHEGLPCFLTDEAFIYLTDLLSKGIVGKLGLAANYVNLIHPNQKLDINWEILQYENSLLHPSSNIIKDFPAKMHILHSVFSPLKYKNFKKVNAAAILLAIATKRNPEGIVLFSTTQKQHIIDNILGAEKYKHTSILELEKVIKDAIY